MFIYGALAIIPNVSYTTTLHVHFALVTHLSVIEFPMSRPQDGYMVVDTVQYEK